MLEKNADPLIFHESREKWLRSLPGQDLCRRESDYLEMVSSRLYGRFLLYFGGICGELPEFHGFRKVIRLGCNLAPEVGLVVEPQRLSIATASVNAVYLSHVLEFAKDPHSLLRDVDRVLIPGGRLLLALFNPWGLYGVRRLLYRRGAVYPWSGEFLGLHRVVDWMRLLGFEVEDIGHLVYRPPVQNPMLYHRLGGLESLGRRLWPKACGVNMVLAVKREVPLSLLRPQWRRGRSFVPNGSIVEPTTRNDQHV
jgi:SAM-dependent methyltransferase